MAAITRQWNLVLFAEIMLIPSFDQSAARLWLAI
jgi:hypothetical protein